MNLRSTQPWWLLRNGIQVDYPPLTEKLACDVAIIGAGVTGALVADRLSAAGMSVVVLDRRSAGEGSTAASTGLLQYETDRPLHRLERIIGERAARRVYRLGVEAIDQLEALSNDISCMFCRRRSVQLASRESHLAALKREAEHRRAAGFACRLLSASTLRAERRIEAPGALESELAGEIDPFRLTHGLLRRSLARGARVHDRTTVLGYSATKRGVTLTTDRSLSVTAHRVLFATGYEALEFGPPVPVLLRSTYALVTDPITDLGRWHDRALVWETAQPYVYLRTTTDQRLMIGGGDVKTIDPERRDRLLPRKSERLAERLRQLVPGAPFDIAFAWAGCFAESVDSLPLIGTAPRFPNAYFALGYGGNGITFSVIAANILTSMIAGAEHPDAALFALDRASPTSRREPRARSASKG